MNTDNNRDACRCRCCGVELNNTNWCLSGEKYKRYICKSCESIQGKEYRSRNKEKVKERNKQRSEEYIRKYNAKQYRDNPTKNKERVREYYKNNRDKVREHKRRYYKEHATSISEKYKIWWSSNSDIQKQRKKAYRQSLNGKLNYHKCNAKRKHNLGYIYLNDYFEGSHGHHIDEEHVIFIPAELNNGISHNVHTGKNMAIINAMAFFFLIQRNIDKLIMSFRQ